MPTPRWPQSRSHVLLAALDCGGGLSCHCGGVSYHPRSHTTNRQNSLLADVAAGFWI
jgi:hypothetical protein